MEAIFLVIHVFIAIALIGVVLLQRSDTDGFGLGSGSGSNFLSGRQTANLLTRTTAILATAFMINSLWLGILTTHSKKASFVDSIEAASQKQDNKTAGAPVTKDVAPATKDNKDAKDTAPVVPKADDAPQAESKPEPAKAKKADAPKADDADSYEGESAAPEVPQAE